MTRDSRISVAAKNFIERFGDDAPAEAKKRVEELRSAGNVASAATWMQIYEEVKVLVERSDTTAH
jgi:hypothetical protein